MSNEQTIHPLQSGMFPEKMGKMPPGYYSGDQANPNLRAFVEAHLVERPYDPEHDDYNVPAFNRPIETTKATAIYNMHTYWSKKPHDAIRQYIEHYTQPGDLVLDPFCGSLCRVGGSTQVWRKSPELVERFVRTSLTPTPEKAGRPSHERKAT